MVRDQLRKLMTGAVLMALSLPFAFAAASVPARAASAGDLALGLEGLYWGISPAEAAKLYPALGTVGIPNPDGSAAITVSQPFQYAGCKGRLSLSFYNGHLSRIRFDQVRGSADCRQQVLRELQEKFGPAYPRFPLANLPGENLEMRSRTTVASYIRLPAPLSIIFDMRELYDNSGERSAALAVGEAFRQKTSCQSVRAEFIPEPGSTVTAPTYEPTVADLNCEYPYLGLALFTQGRVVLLLNVLADGALASGVLVMEKPPGMYAARLTDAAIRIATEKLRYFPATRDGVPVAAEAHLAIDFKITNPIRGFP